MKRRSLGFIALGLVLSWLCARHAAAQTRQADSSAQSLRIGSHEVLLDLVVRDKRGRPVRDLRAEEIEIYEDGARQSLVSFRLLEAAAPANAEAGAQAATTAFDPQRPVNLVTLVFDNLDANGRRLACDAAHQFINTLPANTFVAVFAVNRGMRVLQSFTASRDKLQAALELIGKRADNRFESVSQQIVQQLEIIAKSSDFGPPAGTPGQTEALPAPSGGSGMAPTGAPGGGGMEKAIAQITLNQMRALETAQIDMQARASIEAFLHLVRQQRQLIGRKSLVYFSNGLVVPPHLVPLMRTLTSEANQANVSIYILDARGLDLTVDGDRAREKMALAIAGSAEAQRNGAVSASSFLSGEMAELAIRMNSRGALFEIAESTGGFAVTNTNDLQNPLRRVTDELSSYYAVTYSPANEKLDGRFREITVRLKRPDVKVAARSGYFAVPAVDGKPVLPHETPALTALNAASPPHDFAHTATALHFKATDAGVKHLLLLDTAFADLGFKTDPAKKLYELHVSVMALCKDAAGNVIHRISRNYPINGKLERLASLQRGKLSFSEAFALPPGSYTLETVVHDFIAQKTSAQKQPLVVAPVASKLALSSLFMIKQVEPLNLVRTDDDKPLLTSAGKITPLLAESINAEATPTLSFFCQLYTDTAALPPQTLTLEIRSDEQLIVQQRLDLPKADERGHVASVFTLPMKSFPSGQYEMRVSAQQLQQQANAALSFAVVNPKLRADAPIQAKAEKSADADTALNEAPAGETKANVIAPKALSAATLAASAPRPAAGIAQAAALNVAELLREAEANGQSHQRRLLEYGYNLRKVIYTLGDAPKDFGKPLKEEFFDFEAYPVHGRHVLIPLAVNSKPVDEEIIARERKRAGEALAADAEHAQAEELPSYVTAKISGSYRTRAATLLIDPTAFLRTCEFRDPRYEVLDGRETIALDFVPRPGADLPMATAYIPRLTGTIWLDAQDRVLVRLEAYNQYPGLDKKGKPLPVSHAPKIVYQQSKTPRGEWFPAVIRMNAAGDASALFGLNWDVVFEFTNYQQFNTTAEKEQLSAPSEKKPR